jgi:hypothetical protein
VALAISPLPLFEVARYSQEIALTKLAAFQHLLLEDGSHRNRLTTLPYLNALPLWRIVGRQ